MTGDPGTEIAPSRGQLSDAQVGALLTPPHQSRVATLRGHAHMEAWDIRRWLIRIFGVGGWDQLAEYEQAAEWNPPAKDGKPQPDRWSVIYRAKVTLLIYNPDGHLAGRYEEVAACDATNQPSRGDAHDQALKGAVSGALKRAAVNLGDAMGLSLYNDGKLEPVVGRTLPQSAGGSAVPPTDPPVTPEPEPEPGDAYGPDDVRNEIRELVKTRNWDAKRVAADYTKRHLTRKVSLRSDYDMEALLTLLGELKQEAEMEDQAAKVPA